MDPYHDIKRTLIDFLENYNTERKSIGIFIKKKKNFEFKYRKMIQDITNKEKHLFVFDIQDLEDTSETLIKRLAYSNTLRFLKILEDAIDYCIKIRKSTTTNQTKILEGEKNGKHSPSTVGLKPEILTEDKSLEYQILVTPPYWLDNISIQSLDATWIGKFSIVKGVITNSNYSLNLIKKAIYFCNKCGLKVSKKISHERFRSCLFCPSKKCQFGKFKGNLSINYSQSFFEKFQEISIQETPEKNDQNKVLSSLKVKLFGKMVKTCSLGEFVKIAGILIPERSDILLQGNHLEKVFVRALFLERISLKNEKTNNGKNLEEEIVNIFKDPEVYSRVSFSIAPTIYGLWDIKKASVLSLLSTNLKKNFFFSEIRNSLNILFLGNSGTGKSRLLKSISDLADPGFFVTSSSYIKRKSPHFSEKSTEIKAFTEKKKEFFFNGSLICIDELLSDGKKEILLNTSLSGDNHLYGSKSRKIGQENTIIATSSIRDFSLLYSKEQTNFSKIYSFFDLCFLIDSDPDFDFDHNLAHHVTKLFKDEKISSMHRVIKKKTLKNFFIEASKLAIFFPVELFDLMIYNYVVLRAQDMENFEKNTDIGTLFSLFRLSGALARLRFRKSVSPSDIKEASRLIGVSKKSNENFKSKEAVGENWKFQRKIYNLIRNFSIEKKTLSLNIFQIEKYILSKGFSRQNLVNCLGFYENLNIWTISLIQKKLVFLI